MLGDVQVDAFQHLGSPNLWTPFSSTGELMPPARPLAAALARDQPVGEPRMGIVIAMKMQAAATTA